GMDMPIRSPSESSLLFPAGTPSRLARKDTIMRNSIAIAALLLLLIAAERSEAQERAGGGARGAAPVFKPEASNTVNQTVALRISPKTADEASLVKDSLGRQQGVSDVKLSEDLRTVSCTYQGVYGDLSKLEAKSSGSLLSPARIVLSLSRNPARAKCPTCGVD